MLVYLCVNLVFLPANIPVRTSTNIANPVPFAPPTGSNLPAASASFGSVRGLPSASCAQPTGIFLPSRRAASIYTKTSYRNTLTSGWMV